MTPAFRSLQKLVKACDGTEKLACGRRHRQECLLFTTESKANMAVFMEKSHPCDHVNSGTVNT